jgi:predicted Ser/Thr protein kinase
MEFACPSCAGPVGVLAVREGAAHCASCDKDFPVGPKLAPPEEQPPRDESAPPDNSAPPDKSAPPDTAKPAPAATRAPATENIPAPDPEAKPEPSDSTRAQASVPEDGDTSPPTATSGRQSRRSRRSGRSEQADIVPELENAGPYKVIGEVARGGMGVVYKARDRHLRRDVAIKVLRGAGADAEEVARFRREAEASARLQHSNIVPIHAVGEVLRRPFFVMDFIEGRVLQDMVRAGELSPRTALEIAEQTAEALHYAHQQGVIHRDLKPANIIIDRFGRPQVMDFGLAKQIDDDVGLTKAGTTMGTPAYMPPEQAAGDLAEMDEQSDVYSLGALLYEMLTGKPPFSGTSTMNILMKVLEEEPPLPRSINPRIHRDVETICLKAMDKEKARRYVTAHDFAEDIRRFRAGEAISASPAGFIRRARRAIARNAALAVAALVFVLLSAGGIGYTLYRESAAREAARGRDKFQAKEYLASAAGKLARAATLRRDAAPGWQRAARHLLDEAENEAALGLKLRPTAPEAARRLEEARAAVRELRVAGYLDLAREFEADGQYRAAEKMYRVVLEDFDPEDATALAGLKRARGVGRLWVASDPAGVEATVLTGAEPGEVVATARTPVEGLEVDSGSYRLVLSGEDVGRHEMPLEVGRSAEVRLGEVRLPRAGAAASGMALVPAGTVEIPGAGRSEVGAFAIDRYESGARLGEVPRSGMSWVEAAARCRDSGKRLCSPKEWKRACSGDSGVAFPYGRTFDPSRCWTGALTTPGRAGGRPGCVSPFGIYDMSGNVGEWAGATEAEALAWGGDWSVSEGAFLRCDFAVYLPPGQAAPRAGFRCCADVRAGR